MKGYGLSVLSLLTDTAELRLPRGAGQVGLDLGA